MTNRTDLDLDVVSFVKELSAKNAHATQPIDEAVFYVRKQANKVFVTYFGDDVSLVTAFTCTMENHKDMMPIISSAVDLYFEDQPCEIEQ